MSLVPPTPVIIGSNRLNVAGFPAIIQPYPNVAPFSYRDGLTFEKLFTDYRVWLLEYLVPYVNSVGDDIYDAYNQASAALASAMVEYTGLIADDRAKFEAAIATDRAAFESTVRDGLATITAKTTAAEAARVGAETAAGVAQQWAANTQVLQDQAVKNLLGDTTSVAYAADMANVKGFLKSQRVAIGPESNSDYYGLSSGVRMVYDADATKRIKIAQNDQHGIYGDWSADTSLNPGILIGRNSFTVVGKGATDGKGAKGIYGELIETDIQSANTEIPFVLGLQSEAAYASTNAGGHVGTLISHKVASPSRKDGATAGSADRVYGLYIESTNVKGSAMLTTPISDPTNPNGARAIALYVESGYSVFDKGITIAKNIVATDPAVTGYNWAPSAGARLWVIGSSATNNVAVFQNFPGGSATVDPIRVMDSDGATTIAGITSSGRWRLTAKNKLNNAAALPTANPDGYMLIHDSNGTAGRVPYWY